MRATCAPSAYFRGCVCQQTEGYGAGGNDGAHSPIARKSHVRHSLLASITEKALEAVGGESDTLKSLGGHPETPVPGDTC
jgi:hypothetical protein